MSRRQLQVLAIGTSATAVALLVLWATIEPAFAQRGRGLRRLFGVSRAQLASLPDVQSELKLNDEQKTRVTEINEQLRNERYELLGTAFEGWSSVQPRLEELNRAASAKVSEALDPEQRKRLQQISIQLNGPRALQDPGVVAELGLTKEQRTKLAQAVAENTKDFETAFENSNHESWQQRAEQLRNDSNQRLLNVLNDEQKTKLEELKGEPFEVDLSQLFRRGRGDR